MVYSQTESSDGDNKDTAHEKERDDLLSEVDRKKELQEMNRLIRV